MYNPEPGNNSSAFRKSIDEVANKVGIVSVEAPSGDSSDIDRLIRSLKDEPNSGLVFLWGRMYPQFVGDYIDLFGPT